MKSLLLRWRLNISTQYFLRLTIFSNAVSKLNWPSHIILPNSTNAANLATAGSSIQSNWGELNANYCYYHPRMRRGNAFGHVCVCVSVCPIRALIFENINLENLFLVRITLSEHLCQGRVSRSRSRSYIHTFPRIYLRLKGNVVVIIITTSRFTMSQSCNAKTSLY